MKLSTFLQAAILMLLIAFAASSCRTSRSYPESRRYPPTYPQRYPGDRHDERRVIIIDRHDLPPGHSKKIYRHKSAKVFAPGQKKKRRYERRY